MGRDLGFLPPAPLQMEALCSQFWWEEASRGLSVLLPGTQAQIGTPGLVRKVLWGSWVGCGKTPTWIPEWVG